VAAAKSQTPLLLDLVEPVSKIINFPNLLDLLQWDIFWRPWERVLRGKNIKCPLLILALLLLLSKIEHLNGRQCECVGLEFDLLKLSFAHEV
jgi:hypothetical protein